MKTAPTENSEPAAAIAPASTAAAASVVTAVVNIAAAPSLKFSTVPVRCSWTALLPYLLSTYGRLKQPERSVPIPVSPSRLEPRRKQQLL